MSKPKNQFPLKIILSYLVIGALAVVVSYFLYNEYKTYIGETQVGETEKIIETDSFSRIALLTKSQIDFDTYVQKLDSINHKIDGLKELILNPDQKQLLDSVKILLAQKSTNIEELRDNQLSHKV